MVILLLLLGFVAVAAGMFGLGFGVPVRETTFGAAVLVAASVAITGGFILVGLAAAVSETRRVLQRVLTLERWDAGRSQGAGRRMEPQLARPLASGPDAGHVIPTRFDAPEVTEEGHNEPGEEDRSPLNGADVRNPSASSPGSGAIPAVPPPYDRSAFAPRRTSGAAARFDTIRPSDYRRPEKPEKGASERRAEASPAAGTAPDEVKSPPLSPADATSPTPVRPARVLKSGMINEVAYTLFSDGSIETQIAEGTLRFASIDEFRRHLEKSAG